MLVFQDQKCLILPVVQEGIYGEWEGVGDPIRGAVSCSLDSHYEGGLWATVQIKRDDEQNTVRIAFSDEEMRTKRYRRAGIRLLHPWHEVIFTYPLVQQVIGPADKRCTVTWFLDMSVARQA